MTVTRRAYSFLDIKSVNEEKRIIRGIATTPAVDRVGDVVEPMGVRFKNPMPFLWQHDATKPIGTQPGYQKQWFDLGSQQMVSA